MDTLVNLKPTYWAASSQAITYWAASAFYETIDALGLFQQHRIRPDDEECKKNTVPRDVVFRHMLMYHASTVVTIFVQLEMFPPPEEKAGGFGTLQGIHTRLQTSFPSITDGLVLACMSWVLRIAYLALRQFLAVVVLDAWVFWGHYVLHMPYFYRKFHAMHHRLYTPYAYGALYNHWVESLFSDGLGGFWAITLIQLTAQEQTLFFALITLKTVEDHVAYQLPWSFNALWCKMTGAGAVYHNTHHQTWGLKSNFEIYFTWWDKWMNTTYHGPRSLKDSKSPVPVEI